MGIRVAILIEYNNGRKIADSRSFDTWYDALYYISNEYDFDNDKTYSVSITRCDAIAIAERLAFNVSV